MIKYLSAIVLCAAPAAAEIYTCTFDQQWTEAEGYTAASITLGLEQWAGDCGPYSIRVHFDGETYHSCYREWEGGGFVVTLPLDDGLFVWTVFEDYSSRFTINSTATKNVRFYVGTCEERN